MSWAVLVFVAGAILLISPVILSASAQFDSPTVILRSSFVDSEGRLNVVGTVRNYAQVPVQVTVGQATSTGTNLEATTYGRIIWPLTDAPFKFTLEAGQEPVGESFLKTIAEVRSVHHEMLVLTYDGMAVGNDRAFVGKIKNVGEFDVHNVSVFAAVHSADHTAQLDSVRSNVIPVIRPGEELDFTAVPDPVVRQDVLYYSCAGIDYDEPITTVRVGEGKILAYDLTAVAQVRSFRYENSTDSLAFGIKPYSPSGGDISIKIPQLSSNQTVAVVMDGIAHDSSVKGDGRTMTIDFFVPQGNHEVQIQGVRNVPEFPYPLIGLTGIVAIAIVATRSFKASRMLSPRNRE
jgi:hypothetical protein